MAKLIKKKKKTRKLRIEAVAVFMVILAGVGWLLSSLFINTINTSLTIQIQQMNNEVAALQEANHTLSVEIQSLENKDRVYVIAQDAGLEQDQDNIISVQVD